MTYVNGQLAVTVEYLDTPLPGVWRIGEYGYLYLQELVFDADEGLVTFFPDRLSNFIVGYYAVARLLAIFRADGQHTSLHSRGRETDNLREGQRLSGGDRLVTGGESIIFVLVDNSSIVKLDETSEAEITEAGRILEIRVVSGSVLVRVDNQQQHHETRVVVQNLAITVRGTMFTVGLDSQGNETVVMLSGNGEVNGVPLPAGYMFVLRNDADTTGFMLDDMEYDVDYVAITFEIVPITVEVIDDFTLTAIVGNMYYLAYYFDIDLTGVDISVYALPLPYEISNLVLEDIETDEVDFCEDDCAPMTEPDDIRMLQDRRQVGRRC